jgi:DNA topoisomerase-2
LFSAFKKNLTTEIKVAQFTGYVSEHSGYHHGEASLNAAIVGMAQNFVGSNNINLFVPSGQFGSRLRGGQDSASERYIFTYLNKITRTIFNINDDAILKYLNDDGLPVEPIFYAPIIPMVLVNGSKGIGTGFSTDIMCYNPQEIINYLKVKLNADVENSNSYNINDLQQEFKPYYEGFQGTIETITPSKFLIKGIYEKLGPDKIRVTELPVGFWTDDFKEHLEGLIETVDKNGKKIASIVKDYDDMSKDVTVDFVITLQKGKLEELEAQEVDHGCNGIHKVFKLYNTNSTTNMHLFDSSDKLKKYETIPQIIDDYFETRLQLYQTRKDYLIKALEKDLLLLSNKTKYIREILDGTVDLRKKKKEEIIKMLKDKEYHLFSEDDEYKYLVKMTMDSVTEENIDKLFQEHKNKLSDLEITKNTSKYEMWRNELDILEKEYLSYKRERHTQMIGGVVPKKVVVKKVVKK